MTFSLGLGHNSAGTLFLENHTNRTTKRFETLITTNLANKPTAQIMLADLITVISSLYHSNHPLSSKRPDLKTRALQQLQAAPIESSEDDSIYVSLRGMDFKGVTEIYKLFNWVINLREFRQLDPNSGGHLPEIYYRQISFNIVENKLSVKVHGDFKEIVIDNFMKRCISDDTQKILALQEKYTTQDLRQDDSLLNVSKDIAQFFIATVLTAITATYLFKS